jgi:acyl-CoA thioester hydrolase
MSEAGPTAGWIEGREHRLPIRVYYEDTDFTGVVYHGAYVRFLERGRSDFLRLCGVHHAELARGPEPYAFAVTHLDVAFKRAARVDDALLVRTLYEAVKGPRLLIAQTITRGAELLVQASVEAVCVDLAGRARRPPATLVAAVSPLLAPSP